MKNYVKPSFSDNEVRFFRTEDGLQLFIYEYIPTENYDVTIFLISGITGINHNCDADIIKQLSNNKHRIVVVHPRGTGYSEGKRGDISDFSMFIGDYIEIIKNDKDYNSEEHKIILFGHSMSTAILLSVADTLENIEGAVLINPPYILRKAKGMSPGLIQYLKYAAYWIFAKHSPIVNMAGNPAFIENEDDRKESEERRNDPLLVQYFSMYMMMESKKIMDSMIDFSIKANYPLLLIYGERDNIVDQKGCKMIFDSWKCEDKEYVIIQNGTHGKSSVILAESTINEWIDLRKNK